MRADYINDKVFQSILLSLMPENRLALEISLSTGLRIGDVLKLQRKDILQNQIRVTEQKTGKPKRLTIPKRLRERALSISGTVYVFPHRTDPERSRTVSAVYKDIKRSCKLFRINDLQISPHSARKIYAVKKYHKHNDLMALKNQLNHDNLAVTMLYAMADIISKR